MNSENNNGPTRKTGAASGVCGLLESIGNTAMVELRRIRPDHGARILVKLEGNNPGGSVKDRPALWMIERAEQEGRLLPGKIILEPTSGNTGIGIAMVGACKGYRVKLILPECVSVERRQTLLAYGAELVLTPAAERTDGAIRAAHRIVDEEPDRYFMPNQFANPDNWLSHYESTGPEILEQTGGDLKAFVAGMGTTGTLMGIGRRLKEHDPKIQIVGAEPIEGHAIQGLKNMKESIVPQIYEKLLPLQQKFEQYGMILPRLRAMNGFAGLKVLKSRKLGKRG